jgi:hypothetical protein
MDDLFSPAVGAFDSSLPQPGVNTLSFTLDALNCTNGCIAPTGQSAYLNSVALAPVTFTPEPGTLGMMAAGLLAAFAVRRRTRNVPVN